MLNRQAIRADALVAQKQPLIDILSPRQLAIIDIITAGKIKNKIQRKQKFIENWKSIAK